MGKQLLIIGGGFAGFWSAISAIRQSREIQKRTGVEITLVNPDNYVTLRPGLNELSLEGSRFELDKYLKPLGVHQVTGRAEIINPEKNEATISTEQGIRTLRYDYLILAAGASLKVPDLRGIDNTFNVESFENTQKLEAHIAALELHDFRDEAAATFVVAGSAFTALETVTGIEQKVRALTRHFPGQNPGFRIVLLESENQMATVFSEECRDYIQDVLVSKNIEIISNAGVLVIGPASILLNDGTSIATRTVIWTEGIAASFLTAFFRGVKDGVNRLAVNQFLKLEEYQNVIAAGNVAHSSGDIKQASFADCQFAQFEGRWAGHNAINDLFNIPLKEYVQPGYVDCVDLGEPATLHANEWERAMQKRRYQVIVKEKHVNTATMFPWQDVEETVKASYPRIPKF